MMSQRLFFLRSCLMSALERVLQMVHSDVGLCGVQMAGLLAAQAPVAALATHCCLLWRLPGFWTKTAASLTASAKQSRHV
jgi:hypothetical protein